MGKGTSIDKHIETDRMQDKDVMRLAASICGVNIFALSLIVSTTLHKRLFVTEPQLEKRIQKNLTRWTVAL